MAVVCRPVLRQIMLAHVCLRGYTTYVMLSGANKPTATDIADFVFNMIIPMLAIERTMVMPFDKQRHENVGEHSFSLALLAGSLAEHIDPSLDIGKVTQYALVHHVVEIYVGDVTVWASNEAILSKAKDEELAANKLLENFPLFPWQVRTLREYEQMDTPEKCYVYALDKLYPHLLIIAADHHPVHPTWEAYTRTERIALKKVASFPALLPLFHTLCLEFRRRPHFFDGPIPEEETQRRAMDDEPKE